VALNDEMALGAIRAVMEAGLLGEMFVIGLDATQDALASIRAGQLTATLNTNHAKWAASCVRFVVSGPHPARDLKREIYSPSTLSISRT